MIPAALPFVPHPENGLTAMGGKPKCLHSDSTQSLGMEEAERSLGATNPPWIYLEALF